MNTRLSSQVDHDMRHYSFERRSGLPLAYFDAKRNRLGEWFVVVLAVATGAALVLILSG